MVRTCCHKFCQQHTRHADLGRSNIKCVPTSLCRVYWSGGVPRGRGEVRGGDAGEDQHLTASRVFEVRLGKNGAVVGDPVEPVPVMDD